MWKKLPIALKNLEPHSPQNLKASLFRAQLYTKSNEEDEAQMDWAKHQISFNTSPYIYRRGGRGQNKKKMERGR